MKVGGGASAAAAEAAAEDVMYDDEDEEELDLFGDETDEEKAAKAAVIATAKARGAEKAKLSKSMIILDVKPWDDETDMAKLEAHVRSIVKDGLVWGSSTLVPVGFGVKKLQITVRPVVRACAVPRGRSQVAAIGHHRGFQGALVRRDH